MPWRAHTCVCACARVCVGCIPRVKTSLTNFAASVRSALWRRLSRTAGWGVCAQWRGAAERGDLIDLNAGTFFPPASNTKLYTIAAAQSRLGLESVLSTELWLTEGSSRSAAVLTLKGSGDPTLTFAHLEKAAAAVAPQLDGGLLEIVVDVSVFGRSAIPDAWDWDYVSTTSGVLPSSVVVDRNTMQLTVSATQAGEPAQLVWEHVAADGTVEVDNSVRTGPAHRVYYRDCDG